MPRVDSFVAAASAATAHFLHPWLAMKTQLAVWMDNEEARVFQIDPNHTGVVTIEAPHRHIHSEEEVELAGGAEPPRASNHFFRDIAKALEGADEVLVTGPATSKLGFLKFVHAHDPALEPRIVGVETIAFAGDGQLLRYAQDYFKLSDPMR